MITLRNRLIYAYFNINMQTVWEIVENDLPSLKSQIVDILNAEHEE
ncbi:MAG: DUF86 domain-containing protein [Chloroflexi bacterium]|nr:DUF86 domain-containing protein [Chloroflexota bacterium]